MTRITKEEMARILSRCEISGLYGKNVKSICKIYSWQELKDMYDQMNESWNEYYENRF